VQLREDGTLAIDDLRGGRRFEGLHALENEVEMGDLYNFCPLDGAGVWRCAGASARVLSDGLSRWQLEVSYPGELPVGVDAELRPRSETVALSLTTVVRLVRESDRIEFRTTIDNRAKEHRLIRVSARCRSRIRSRRRPVRGRRAPDLRAEPRAQWCEPPGATQHAIGVVALGPLALLTGGPALIRDAVRASRGPSCG
jgi:hypothetical protein